MMWCTSILDPPYLDSSDMRAFDAGMLDHRELVQLLKKSDVPLGAQRVQTSAVCQSVRSSRAEGRVPEDHQEQRHRQGQEALSSGRMSVAQLLVRPPSASRVAARSAHSLWYC
jgi:hypothetical protein